MKKHLIGAAALLMTSQSLAVDVQVIESFDAWEAAWGQSYTTIDFTGFEDNTPITEQYAHLGAHFPAFNVIDEAASSHPQDGWGLQSFDIIDVVFDAEMTTFAAHYPGVERFEFYSNGAMIYQSGWYGGDPGSFTGFISNTPFDRVVFYNSTGSAFVDNIYFGPPVPAPGMLAAFPLLLLAGRRRQE